MRVEIPDRPVDRAVVSVDQQWPLVLVLVSRVPRQMDLAHLAEREAVEISPGVPGLIGRRDLDVVDVEKQPTSAPPEDLCQEISLGEAALGESQVSR